MRTRLWSFVLALAVALLVRPSFAGPQATILRIDPRASQTEGAPVLTTVLELVQPKRMSDAIAECATLRGNAQLDCQSGKLEAPQALYTPLAPFPEAAALFTVAVDGADRPSQFVSKARWGDSLNQPGVGTAWLLLVDASSTMSSRFDEAKAVADAFVASMTPGDIVDVMFFGDRQVVQDSKWQSASAKGNVTQFINGVRSTYPAAGRTRPLFNIIKQAATDAFGELGNTDSKVKVPLHQAMVVLSNGYAGGDASSSGPMTTALNQYLTKGRFPEDNTALPMTPLPVVSVLFPYPTYDEFAQNAQEFMQGLANPEIGGFYTIVRDGQASKAPKIVQAVRTRFNQMHIVKWRVSCVAPTITQTFRLVFTNTSTPIAGDSRFKDVPMGIDPSQWPLDVNVQYTKDRTKAVEPGGDVKIFGNFCWGGEKDRAEIYFVPAGTNPPADLGGGDLAAAQRVQQQLIASGMRGKAVQSSDSDVEFTAPDDEKILSGTGDNQVVRFVVYDNRAHRASGVTASTILTLKGSPKTVNWLLVVSGAFGLVVLALLAVIALRGTGGKKRGVPTPPPAPVVAGGPQPVVAHAPPPAAPGGYAAPQPGYAAAPQPAYGAAPGAGYAAAPPAPSPEFLYGGQPPQYGITGGQPAHGAPPPDPYGGYGAAPAAAVASRATLAGAAGVYSVAAGFETRVGRDAGQCQIVLNEPRVSSLHATVKVENGQLWVRDERSNNGTWVDGNRLAPGAWTPVVAGTVLRFGPLEFNVRLE